ncbi:hypothetical protein [Pectobacterium sp. LFLA-215]|uniref:hypothetical protein n=1 Tax=Pectobacterium TaxID=122277 RepID=UPI003F5B5466
MTSMVRRIKLECPSLITNETIKLPGNGRSTVVNVKNIGDGADMPVRAVGFLNGHDAPAVLNKITWICGRLLGP